MVEVVDASGWGCYSKLQVKTICFCTANVAVNYPLWCRVRMFSLTCEANIGDWLLFYVSTYPFPMYRVPDRHLFFVRHRSTPMVKM